MMTIKYGIMFSFLQGHIGAYGREKEREKLIGDGYLVHGCLEWNCGSQGMGGIEIKKVFFVIFIVVIFGGVWDLLFINWGVLGFIIY